MRKAIRRGDIYWINPDGSRGSIPGRPHPHVIVQDDVLNQSRIHTVVVMGLTTNLNRASEPGNVLLDPGEGGLDKLSVVVVSQVDSVEKRCLGEYVGTLSDQRVLQILDGLRFQQTSYF